MTFVQRDPVKEQHEYYARTALDYDNAHSDEEHPEHALALRHIAELARGMDCRSALDVGCGTGRAYLSLKRTYPDLDLRGIDPVPELLDIAIARGVPRENLDQGEGGALPYPSGSFDAVMELGVLHHVQDPAPVVAEMLWVARKAVFISDFNRFGNGNRRWRRIKFALWRLGLWSAAWRLATLGRGYGLSEGDGVFYSYSVYDSLSQVAGWATRVILIPTVPTSGSKSVAHPLLTSNHVLLCGLQEDESP